MLNPIMWQIEQQTRRFLLASFLRDRSIDSSVEHKIICFGGGALFTEFSKLYGRDLFSYIVDNKIPHSQSVEEFSSPSRLLKEDPSRVTIVIASSAYSEIRRQLREMGFYSEHHCLNASLLICPFTPFKCFVSKENLSSWLDVLASPEGEFAFGPAACNLKDGLRLQLFADQKFLQHIDSLSNTFSAKDDHVDGFIIDVNAAYDSNTARVQSIFQKKTVEQLLSNRIRDADGFWTLNEKDTFLVSHYLFTYLAEDCCVQNINTVFERCKLEQKSKVFPGTFGDSGQSVAAQIEFLSKNLMSIPLDRARQMERQFAQLGYDASSLRMTLLPRRMFEDKELIVFVLREAVLRYDLLNEIKNFYEQKGLIWISTNMFQSENRSKIETLIRSGNWSSTEIDRLSGGPVGLICFADINIEENALSKLDDPSQTYIGNKCYRTKAALRKTLSRSIGLSLTLNFVHSPDDEREALQYLDLIGSEGRELIMSIFHKIETRSQACFTPMKTSSKE
jgi:hypothetical protein